MDTSTMLFLLIRSELKENTIDLEIKNSINVDFLEKLYALSVKHDIAHLIAHTLSKAKILNVDKPSQDFKKAMLMSISRHERIEHELLTLYKLFNEIKIPFIPLKGAIIKKYYPEPWLRTSCDIDILIREEDLERAVALLVSEKKYVVDGNKNYHDISLFSPSGVHLELHFNIKEDIESLDRVLDNIWQYATPSAEMEYKYELKSEFLLFHIVAHLSYHFLGGGCGIRPIIDLWILEKSLKIDNEIFNRLLGESNLSRFYENLKKLTFVWLEGEEYTDITKQMEEYILSGGVYGSLQNRVLVQQQKKKGKIAYIFSRIFMSYDSLKILYPVIERHKWLVPIAQVRRWCSIIFSGRAKRSIQELKYNNNISKSQAEKMKVFLDKIGL